MAEIAEVVDLFKPAEVWLSLSAKKRNGRKRGHSSICLDIQAVHFTCRATPGEAPLARCVE